jgi:hypothetical protein
MIDWTAKMDMPPNQSGDRERAIEEFDRFCRFIDGMNMGGFVENDFMSKPIQKIIKEALARPPAVDNYLLDAIEAAEIATPDWGSSAKRQARYLFRRFLKAGGILMRKRPH